MKWRTAIILWGFLLVVGLGVVIYRNDGILGELPNAAAATKQMPVNHLIQENDLKGVHLILLRHNDG